MMKTSFVKATVTVVIAFQAASVRCLHPHHPHHVQSACRDYCCSFELIASIGVFVAAEVGGCECLASLNLVSDGAAIAASHRLRGFEGLLLNKLCWGVDPENHHPHHHREAPHNSHWQ